MSAMIYNIHISDPWYDSVRTGKKKYEGRRYYFDIPKYKREIIFESLDINAKIVLWQV